MLLVDNLLIFTCGNSYCLSILFLSLSTAAMEIHDHTVLSMDDVKYFCKARYKTQTSKFAYDVYTFMDLDGDGGLDAEEWHEFAERNVAFVSCFHKFLMHLRKCIFGLNFWVQRTRILKKRAATGLRKLIRTAKINVDSEEFCAKLNDPVVDKNGNTTSFPPYIPVEGQEVADQFGNITKLVDEKELERQREKKKLVAELLGDANQDEEKDSRKARVHQEALKEETNELLEEEEENEMAEEAIDPKSTLICRDPFGFNRIPRTSKSKDFAELIAMKKANRSDNEKQNKKMDAMADKFAGRTYDLMVNTITDLICNRRPIRLGFNRWLDVVGLTSTLPKIIHTAKKKKGQLTVEILEGSDIKYAAGTFGKKTCVVSIKCGAEEFISEPSSTAGKHQVWGEEFTFTNMTSDDKVVIFDVRAEDDDSDKPKSFGRCSQVLKQWTDRFPGPKYLPQLNLLAVGQTAGHPVGQLNVAVKYAEKGGGDTLQLRLGTSGGIGASVDKMMSTEAEEKDEEVDELEGGGGALSMFTKKKDEERRKKKSGEGEIDGLAIHKKIIETTNRMSRDREMSAFNDYKKSYIAANVECKMIYEDRTVSIKKLKEAAAYADKRKSEEESR